MLIGHLGVGLAAKKLDSRVPLWVLLVAAVFVDLINCFFLFIGVEVVRVAPGYTAWVPLELVSIPWTHSLALQLFWAAFACGAVLGFARSKKIENPTKVALLLGGVVFLHYFCDALVHVRDLALWPGSIKIGLGLWNYPLISNTIEIAFFGGGLLLYAAAMRSSAPHALAYVIGFAAINISLQVASGFIPPYTTNVAVVALNLLFTFVLLIALGWFMERKLLRKASA
ncbi:MAG: hypothetical protein JNM27_09210 [Leptospirales bacterium]|nr:hypothetical protein [Leptospirales bacterium]